MKKRHATIFLITALFLTTALSGLTPLNFAYKLGKGCPIHPAKNALTHNLCQNYFSAQEPKPDSPGLLVVPESFCPEITTAFVSLADYQSIVAILSLKDPPLRC